MIDIDNSDSQQDGQLFKTVDSLVTRNMKHQKGNGEWPLYQDYDFDDLGLTYSKRRQSEYYDQYDANDLREKGLYPGPASNEGLSRNRNRQFEAMNQQLQHFPRKRPPQHQPLPPQIQPSPQLQQHQQQQQSQPNPQPSQVQQNQPENVVSKSREWQPLTHACITCRLLLPLILPHIE